MTRRFCKIQNLVDEGILHKPIDGNHGNIHPKSTDFVDDGIPFVMASDMQNGMVDLERANKISALQASKLQKGFSYEGDILLSHKGSIGLVAKVPELETDYIMLTPQVTYYRVKNVQKLDADYIKYYFLTDKFQWTMKNLSGGGTRAYIGISAQRELPFILPGIETQKTIVRILSIWDDYLEKLDQKIKAKKQIKKGLTQQLLTGNKRLYGFSDIWINTSLGDLCTFQNGFAFKSTYFSDTKGIRLIRNRDLKDIPNENFLYFDSTNYSSEYLVNDGDVLIGMDGDFLPKLWSHGEALLNQRVGRLKEFHDSDPYFMYQLTRKILKKIENSTSSTTVKHLSSKQFEAELVTVPCLKEQIAIASILRCADNELDTLVCTRKLLTEQRKYLLNNLVEGKIIISENLEIKETVVHA